MGQDSKSNRGELGEIRTQLAALASGGQILELNRHRMQCKSPHKPVALHNAAQQAQIGSRPCTRLLIMQGMCHCSVFAVTESSQLTASLPLQHDMSMSCRHGAR